VACANDIVYTNEYTGDYNELIYLRARFYAPGMGRFLTRDTWSGLSTSPISYNKWVYSNDNPLYYIDPSGNIPFPLLLLLLGLGVGIPFITSGCTEQSIATSTVATSIAYPSDCRNMTNWYVEELTDLALSVNGDPVSFINAVAPGGWTDWRDTLRRRFDNAIIFCWIEVNCGFYDVSVPGNIAYGYLGAQAGIPRQTLHDVASLGQLNEDILRQLGLSDLPPGIEPGVIHGFDTPGDFQAIAMGYDLWEQYKAWITNDEFMQTLNLYHSVLEIGIPNVEYLSEGDYIHSAEDCGKNPP
jgi:RHS repeat-associated protein